MAKKKLPRLLELRNQCRKEEGVQPFKKETPAQKKAIEVCLIRKEKADKR